MAYRYHKCDVYFGEMYVVRTLEPTFNYTSGKSFDDIIWVVATLHDDSILLHYIRYCPFCGDELEEELN